MKKILIIQTDSTYYLEETLRAIEDLKDYFIGNEIYIFTEKSNLEEVTNNYSPLIKNIYTDEHVIISKKYDISFNLSSSESSRKTHQKINSNLQVGPNLYPGGNLKCEDLWSTFFLTQNSNDYFQAFHIRDIFRNILGVKNQSIQEQEEKHPVSKIIIGRFESTKLKDDITSKLKDLSKSAQPSIKIFQLSDIDFIDDFRNSIYIGPPCLESLRLNDLHARSILISNSFRGMKLVPYSGGNFFLSLKFNQFDLQDLVNVIFQIISGQKKFSKTGVSIYETTLEYGFGSGLKCHANPETLYIFYQLHTVLWNYVLNLFDINLVLHHFREDQIDYVSSLCPLIDKIQRLLDFAVNNCEKVLLESKKELPCLKTIQDSLEQIREIESILENISSKHFSLSSILDFYKIKRSQDADPKLSSQAQVTLINFMEQKHVLSAFKELLDLIVNKNGIKKITGQI